MSDAIDRLPELLRDFVEAEKACPAPPSETEERVLTRLSATLGLPPVAGEGSAAAPSEGLPSASGTTAAKAGTILRHVSRRGFATFLVGAAVGASVYGTAEHFVRRGEPTARPPTEAPAVLAPAPPAPAEAAAAEADVPAPAPVTGPPPARARPNEPSRDRGLGAERKLIEMARSALARGQADGALASLARHARAFPNGQLGEERDSLRVQALVAKGRLAEARSSAERFRRKYPRSLFIPVVERALQSIP
jgi:hypothetical protein